MKRSFLRRRGLPAMLVLALALAACGGNDEPATDSSDTTDETQAPADEPDTEPADDEEPATTPEPSDDAAAGSELSGEIAGAGASSQQAAKDAWIAGFQTENPGVTVSYDPIGSGGGREQFLAGGTSFGGTDSLLGDEELDAARDRCGEFIFLPIYISPIAIIYNLPDVEDLQLDAATLAQIMDQQITNWNDPAIAELNPDANLPDLAITPVNRSDGSGTTENFVDYLSKVTPENWSYEVSDEWPVPGGEAAQGTSGVVAAVTAGEGSIGYADASQAANLGHVSIQVGDDFVGPTPEAAAEIVAASSRVEGEQFEFAYELARDTTEAGTYPIVLISYEMACTDYDDASEAAIVKGFMQYLISEEGQQAAADAAGSAPISDEVRDMLQPAIDAIGS